MRTGFEYYMPCFDYYGNVSNVGGLRSTLYTVPCQDKLNIVARPHWETAVFSIDTGKENGIHVLSYLAPQKFGEGVPEIDEMKGAFMFFCDSATTLEENAIIRVCQVLEAYTGKRVAGYSSS